MEKSGHTTFLKEIENCITFTEEYFMPSLIEIDPVAPKKSLQAGDTSFNQSMNQSIVWLDKTK